VKAYKNKGVQNKVTFVLSSKNLGEAIRRVQYIKQYGEYQDKKAAEISDKANQIKTSINQKQKSVKEKDALLNRQKQDFSNRKRKKR
jgi:pyridoxal biosynthesis lyase PdxS